MLDFLAEPAGIDGTAADRQDARWGTVNPTAASVPSAHTVTVIASLLTGR